MEQYIRKEVRINLEKLLSVNEARAKVDEAQRLFAQAEDLRFKLRAILNGEAKGLKAKAKSLYPKALEIEQRRRENIKLARLECHLCVEAAKRDIVDSVRLPIYLSDPSSGSTAAMEVVLEEAQQAVRDAMASLNRFRLEVNASRAARKKTLLDA